MKLSQFKFKLPEELIATVPCAVRDESRLMVVNRKTGEIEHHTFKEIINYFGDGDVFILNDTMVFPARLYGNKEKTGAKIEVFLLRELNEENKLWDVLVEPAGRFAVPARTDSPAPLYQARTRSRRCRALSVHIRSQRGCRGGSCRRIALQP